MSPIRSAIRSEQYTDVSFPCHHNCYALKRKSPWFWHSVSHAFWRLMFCVCSICNPSWQGQISACSEEHGAGLFVLPPESTQEQSWDFSAQGGREFLSAFCAVMSFAVAARASGIFTPGKRAKGVERMESDSSQLLVKRKTTLKLKCIKWGSPEQSRDTYQ